MTMFKKYTVLGGFFVALTAASSGSLATPVDPFGSQDVVYLDSVSVTAGSQVVINVNVRNDETLGALSIPLRYDTTRLTLKSVSFAGSRAEYIATRLVNPALAEAISGHFVVGIIRLSEAPLPPGDGMVFQLTFDLSPTMQPGELTVIDSQFYSPGGELLLVESGTSSQIRPVFSPGKILVRERNRSPLLAAVDDRSVIEGDSLVVVVRATDPDGDQITLAAPTRPSGATFTDNGNGTGRFAWVPDFVGPQSSENSPFLITLWASDGKLSSQRQFGLTVANRNRAPVLSSPSLVEVDAGELLTAPIDLVEPDFEPVSWRLEGLPVGASFSDLTRTISWPTRLTDTGDLHVSVIATDPSNFADTAAMTFRVNVVPIYTLSLDSARVFPGEVFTYELRLNNLVPIGGFNLLFSYDPSVLTLQSVSRAGTRVEQFESFTTTLNDNGLIGAIRLEGTADLPGDAVTPLLPPGSGAVVQIRFRATSDLDFAGQFLPTRFQFLDSPDNNDNTLIDSTGARITQEQITFVSGGVQLQSIGEIMVGDLNLNGLAYEIGDALTFSNYFISPSVYPFEPLQYANSDVNGDGLAATVSDLVRLINIIVDGGPNGSVRPAAGQSASTPGASVVITSDNDETLVTALADAPIAAMLVTATYKGTDEQVSVSCQQSQMQCGWQCDDGVVRVLVYSLNGEQISSGQQELVSISGAIDLTVTSVELVDPAGTPFRQQAGEVTLPDGFHLEQNYPNPFNPETEIAFTLGQSGVTELVIYNVMGQQIRQLLIGDLPAGAHSIRWDGTDASGSPVASGVYFYRLSAGTWNQTRKMLLVK